jgi:type I restriction enzyme R subunit
MSEYSENTLIEQPTIELFAELGWETCNALREFEHAGGSPLGRDNQSEIVLVSRLRPALERLNPDLPAGAFEQVIEELTRDRSRLSLAQANREIYDLIKNGVRVTVPDDENGGETVQNVRLIDWTTRSNNHFLLVSQFWITGEMYTRRPDLIGFVNGLPLVFIELKAIHKQLKDAFDKNLTDYKSTIPPLFWYNALLILSNGSLSRIGSITANWEHFAEWKKINSEGETGVISLETLIRGTCEPKRLLDIIENFILFMDVPGGYIKLLGKNHQYLGVKTPWERWTASRRGRDGLAYSGIPRAAARASQ